MNYKAFRFSALAAVMVIALLAGCNKTTHVTREDQLAHVTNPPSTAAVLPTEETGEISPDTTAAPADTTVNVTEKTDTEEATDGKQTEPASTKATNPPSTKATQPPETTVPETTEATQPVTEPTEAVDDPYDISGYVCGSLEYAVADAVNAQRREAGLPELTLSHRLSAIASVRAYESSVTFSHTRPDGRDFSTVLPDYGYDYGLAGENMLQCSDGYSASDMVSLWMGSSGHRANILAPDVTTLGVAAYRSGGIVYVATLFTD